MCITYMNLVYEGYRLDLGRYWDGKEKYLKEREREQVRERGK